MQRDVINTMLFIKYCQQENQKAIICRFNKLDTINVLLALIFVDDIFKVRSYKTGKEPWRTLAHQEVILRIGPLAKLIEAM
jgi:hypothetical protein